MTADPEDSKLVLQGGLFPGYISQGCLVSVARWMEFEIHYKSVLLLKIKIYGKREEKEKKGI